MFASFWIKFTYLCLRQVYGVFSLILGIWPFCSLWFHSLFGNVMMQFITNKRTGALKKSYVNLFNQKNKPLILFRVFCEVIQLISTTFLAVFCFLSLFICKPVWNVPKLVANSHYRFTVQKICPLDVLEKVKEWGISMLFCDDCDFPELNV